MSSLLEIVLLQQQAVKLLLGVLVISAAIFVATTAVEVPNSNCNRKCGSLEIPYPFGTSEDCYLDSSFLITCKSSSSSNAGTSTPTPFLRKGNIEVRNISLADGELRVSVYVARDCPLKSNYNSSKSYSSLKVREFPISYSKNVFTAIGCDTMGLISSSSSDKNYTTGCVSLCDSIDGMVNNYCPGVGCCQTPIPNGIKDFKAWARSPEKHSKVSKFNPCSFAFVVEEKAYKFSTLDLQNMQGKRAFPLVLDWAVGNQTCEDAKKNTTGYACKAANSECYDSTNGPGYRCNCSLGYDGNPYLSSGCKDIDECKTPNHGCADHACVNHVGSYSCSCPNGYQGDGLRNGIGRQDINPTPRITAIALGASAGLGVLFLLIGGWVSYKVVKKRKRIERRQEFFKRNGGLLLQQQISQSGLNVENMKVFNSKDLERATDHFNVNRILGQGGQGTVYKGMLDDGRIVAVKKSKIIDAGKLQEFINEVFILSRINHRNIVKLLGCCLETEVPLLVYEFVPNGTLSRYLSDQNEEFPPTWDMCLRIATEIAGALYYLHSAASIPIYHRDIKSANILLDDKYRAKVADFGTSRSVAIDQTHLTTLVHGTFGYLDPEYFQSSQFTEKSDVYSFGVVLVELLTGEKAISLTRAPEAKSLAMYFIYSMEENNLFSILDKRILKEAVEEELIAVANLAKRCLNLDGKKRPTMKEVSMELEAVKISQKTSSLEMCERDDRPTVKEAVVMLDGLRGKEKQTRKEANLNTETEYLLSASTQYSLSIDVGVGYSSTSTI